MAFKSTCPDGCRTAIEHERELVALAELLESKARTMLAGDVRIGVSAGKELALAAIRARKQASELALAREGREHDDWIVREYQKLQGVVRDRPQLQRKGR